MATSNQQEKNTRMKIRNALYAFHSRLLYVAVPALLIVVGVATPASAQAALTFTDPGDVPGTGYAAIGDFNNDNIQDMVIGGGAGAQIRLGDGAGGFSAAPDVAFPGQINAVAVGDFNNDGKQDFAASNYTGNWIDILLGDGTGGFSRGGYAATFKPTSVVVGDFNGDGYQDVASTNTGFNTISIRLGNGTGAFPTGSGCNVNAGGALTPWALAIGDFNNDGHQDFAVANKSSHFVSICLGNGDGTFSLGANADVGDPYGFSIAVGDFNGDGDHDLAVSHAEGYNNNKVSILLGDGLGGFTAAADVVVGQGPYNVAIGDFNNDGHDDFATTSYWFNQVSIRLGDGTGSFVGAADIDVGARQYSIVTGDFNGDGAQDFAATNSLGNTSIRLGASLDAPPTASAGADFSVNEGQSPVTLDGSGSTDPDNDPLTYAWAQLSGATVTLSDAAAQQPTFTAPDVPTGGGTLTFELTVTANGKSVTDTVDITVVNVNHTPVADAGDDDSIAEGSPVTLRGEDSFDIDNDTFTYAWVQVDNGSPTVTLTGADTANPTFTAPQVASGATASLVFQLTVDDGFPQDTPADGYTFADVVDSVTITITNVNNDPTAAAGDDQTVDENTPVSLSGALSSDPDSDELTYFWVQTGGTSVFMTGGMTASPSFTAPFVSPGGEALTFLLTVNDGYGGEATDEVVVHVLNANDPPLISAARPTIGNLWPPNHGMVLIGITGVSDPDNNATITIDAVFQDEPTSGTGDGDTPVDAIINGDGTVFLRAERSGNGNGRVYYIHFTASDPEGSVSGIVRVTVRHNKKTPAIADGELYDSTQ